METAMWNFLRRLGLGRRSSTSLGAAGESFAAESLQQLGWQILARSYRHRLGEIDLIARDGETLVFIEVKTRTGIAHGLPVDAVNHDKQRRITRTALAYLKHHGWLDCRCRFDVIAVVWPAPDEAPQLTHYRHAFEPSGFGQMYS